MRFSLIPKSLTLDDREPSISTLMQKRSVFCESLEPTTKKWIKMAHTYPPLPNIFCQITRYQIFTSDGQIARCIFVGMNYR